MPNIPGHPRYNREQLEPGGHSAGRIVMLVLAVVTVGALLLGSSGVALLFVLGVVCLVVVPVVLAWHVALVCREDAEIARARKAQEAAEASSRQKKQPPLA